MSVAEAKARFAEAVKKAEAGQRVLITRYGSPVVALVPLSEVAPLPEHGARAAAQGLVALAGGWQGSSELAVRISEVQAERTPPRGRPFAPARGPGRQRRRAKS
jgi:prevent-host-death family protein